MGTDGSCMGGSVPSRGGHQEMAQWDGHQLVYGESIQEADKGEKEFIPFPLPTPQLPGS